MREQNGRNQERESLVKGLKDKLEWYTMCASDEEYDEKAVESILYLLDNLEPLEKEEEPEPEEAWGRFQMLVREREEENLSGTAEEMEAGVPGTLEMVDAAEIPDELELLEMAEVLGEPEVMDAAEVLEELEPMNAAEVLGELESVEMAEVLERLARLDGMGISGDMAKPELEDIAETAERGRRAGKAKSRKRPKVVGTLENGKETEGSGELGISAKLAKGQTTVQTGSASARRGLHGLSENQKGAVLYNKYIVAAVLLLLVVSMVGIISNVQAGASPDTGFFHWLKRDNTGIQMITSPEDLDGETDVQGAHIYSDSEDVPEWGQEWLKIDNEFEMPENYKWDCYEVHEGINAHRITSYYLDKDLKQEMLLGMTMYHGIISFNTEGLAGYNYVDSYEVEQKEMNILRKTDEMGMNFYLIYFFEGNCQYYMQGQDNLEELKELIERYWLYVKNNLEENEIICNKLLSQAIYK